MLSAAEDEEALRKLERKSALICENCIYSAVDGNDDLPWIWCTAHCDGDNYEKVYRTDCCDDGMDSFGNRFRVTCSDCAYADCDADRGIAHCDYCGEGIELDDSACSDFAREG